MLEYELGSRGLGKMLKWWKKRKQWMEEGVKYLWREVVLLTGENECKIAS